MIAPISGVLILLAAMALAIYTANQGPLLVEKQQILSHKYLNLAQQAYQKKDFKKAETLSLKAIKINSNSKQAVTVLKQALLAQHYPSQENSPNNNSSISKPEEDSDDEMGCI